MWRFEPLILENNTVRLSTASGTPLPSQLEQNHRKIVSVWSGSVSAQLKTTVYAPSACFYTAQWWYQTGHHPWTVRGSRGSNRYHFRCVGGGPSIYLAAPVSWMLPPSTTPLSAAGRSNLLTQSLTCPGTAPMLPARLKWIGPLREFIQNQWLMV